MIVIACGVSCFCCRDRNAAKDNIPCEYHEKLMEKEIEMELFYHFCSIALLFLIWIIKRFLAIFCSALWNHYVKNANEYGSSTRIHDGSTCWKTQGSTFFEAIFKILDNKALRCLLIFIQLREMYLLFAIDVICARPISNFLLKKSLFQKSETFDVSACIRFWKRAKTSILILFPSYSITWAFRLQIVKFNNFPSFEIHLIWKAFIQSTFLPSCFLDT